MDIHVGEFIAPAVFCLIGYVNLSNCFSLRLKVAICAISMVLAVISVNLELFVVRLRV